MESTFWRVKNKLYYLPVEQYLLAVLAAHIDELLLQAHKKHFAQRLLYHLATYKVPICRGLLSAEVRHLHLLLEALQIVAEGGMQSQRDADTRRRDSFRDGEEPEVVDSESHTSLTCLI